MSQRFTREEFYELVWSKPLTHLAKQFGLSDVALHKVCRKHDIPHPPLGWWAKHAAGQKVKRTPLPKPAADVATTVVIAGGELRHEPDEIASAREQARIRASGHDPVAEDALDPIVTASFAKLRADKVGANGLATLSAKGLISLAIAPASIDRIELAMHRIAAAAQVQGLALSKAGEHAAFSDGEVTVPFNLVETVKRSKHVPTEEEVAKREKARKAEARRSTGNVWDRDVSLGAWWLLPEWDYNPTGLVALEFDIYRGYATAVRKSFRDAKVQRLENMAADIAIGLAVIAVAKADHDRKAEAARIQAEEERLRRIEAKRQAYIADRRGKVLGKVFERIEERDRLRALVTQLSAELARADVPRVATFVEWANRVLNAAERGVSATGLADLFERENVFGGDDDKGFYPSAHGW